MSFYLLLISDAFSRIWESLDFLKTRIKLLIQAFSKSLGSQFYSVQSNLPDNTWSRGNIPVLFPGYGQTLARDPGCTGTLYFFIFLLLNSG